MLTHVRWQRRAGRRRSAPCAGARARCDSRATGSRRCVACEIEFYLLKEEAGGKLVPAGGGRAGERQKIDAYSLQRLDDLAPVFDEVYRAAAAQGLPAETLMSEYSPGQFEITLHHRADALRAVDEAVMFKRALRGAAQKHGLIACFMAKPFTARAGSGLHVHVSMNDADGHNLFASDDPAGTPLLRHAIGGMQATHGRVDGGVRAQREFLPALRERELCAGRADLGHQQSLRVACACRRGRPPRGTSSTASPARTPICISRWPPCSRARRMASQARSIRAARRRQWLRAGGRTHAAAHLARGAGCRRAARNSSRTRSAPEFLKVFLAIKEQECARFTPR